ncbi:uncharacterized protein C16orf86 homolog [Carlito syrichta]|uniref:Uncharacterized protein C16orf86 homolog n=1 Tax=Carlito syrichta TaxID=1868482 RepID=A0A3Q0ECQ7_CARSF|nr:uncharacterized protein C16orf86 homolog [Carlito syrichta]
MTSAGVEKRPGTQEPAQLVEAPSRAQTSEVTGKACPMMAGQCLVPAHEACETQEEDRCPTGAASKPELQEKELKQEEERLKQEEERLKPEVEALEERGPRPTASILRPSHGPKRKLVKSLSLPEPSYHANPRAEAELLPGLLLQKEEPEGSQSESSPSAKQHKKAKKRKTLGISVLPATANTMPTPSETLRLERKAQRLRPLYQYINYCNPELNQAGEGEREAEAKVEAELEQALVPEEAGVEQLQALLPVAGELDSSLALPCPNTLVPSTQVLAPLGEETREEPRGLPSLGASGHLKAEEDKSSQVDIDKMLSVCAAPLVPPLSPQYK